MSFAKLLHGTLAGTLILCLGCGGGGKKRTVPVEGRVTIDGVPLEGATVLFHPTTSGRQIAHGITGKDGQFRLTSFNTGDGAEPGAYKIVVNKAAKTADPAGLDPSKMGSDYVSMMKSTMPSKSGRPPAKPASEVHMNYQKPELTPLQATVPDEGDKNMQVPLKKDGT